MSNFIFTNQFYNDDKGRTLPKARLYFYDNNTFNFTDVYSDPELTQVLDNPVTADGAGRFPQIFMDISKTYRVWLKDRNDVQVTPYIDDYSLSASISDLGTAAFADLTTSVTSENTASVSKVGTGGLVVPMPNMDWNTFDAGLNVFIKGSVNSPTGINVFGFQSSDGASYATRFAGRNGAFYTQSVEAGVVGSWNEIWTTNNTTVDINGFVKEL